AVDRFAVGGPNRTGRRPTTIGGSRLGRIPAWAKQGAATSRGAEVRSDPGAEDRVGHHRSKREHVSLRTEDLLRAMDAQGAPDLHIKAGSAPGCRIDGEGRPQADFGRLTPETPADLARQIMRDDQWARFEAEKDIDFSFAVKALALPRQLPA